MNGVKVLDEPYEKAADRTQSSGTSFILLVCGKKVYDYFQAKRIPIVSSLADHRMTIWNPKKEYRQSEQDSCTAKELARRTTSSSSNSEDTKM